MAKKLKIIPKALMGDQTLRPHYYGIYTNNAQINGSRRKPKDLFNDLDPESQEKYHILAQQENINNTVSMYNLRGEQIILDKPKRFIIMVLQEIYNEQVVNNYNFNDPDFMMPRDKAFGKVFVSAYTLACRIYNTKNPGSKVNFIARHLRELAGYPGADGADTGKWRGMLVYRVPNPKTGELDTIMMYDNLISLGLKLNKHATTSFIKLHEAFFANLPNAYIHCFPTSSKLAEFYDNKIPPQYTITLDQLLKQAGSLGNKKLRMRASLIYDTLAHERFDCRNYNACKKITIEAIEACKYTGILVGHKEYFGATGELVYELEINQKFFPRKENKTEKV